MRGRVLFVFACIRVLLVFRRRTRRQRRVKVSAQKLAATDTGLAALLDGPAGSDIGEEKEDAGSDFCSRFVVISEIVILPKQSSEIDLTGLRPARFSLQQRQFFTSDNVAAAKTVRFATHPAIIGPCLLFLLQVLLLDHRAPVSVLLHLRQTTKAYRAPNGPC